MLLNPVGSATFLWTGSYDIYVQPIDHYFIEISVSYCSTEL